MPQIAHSATPGADSDELSSFFDIFDVTDLGMAALILVGLTATVLVVVALSVELKPAGRLVLLAGAVAMFGLTLFGLSEGLFRESNLELPRSIAPVRVEIAPSVSTVDTVSIQLITTR